MKPNRWLPLAVCIAVFAIAFSKLPSSTENSLRSPHLAPVAVPSSQSEAPSLSTSFLSDGVTRLVHAPSLAQVGQDIVAVWFGGTREGATDVKLYSDHKNFSNGDWGSDRVVMTPERTAETQHRYVRKLGNAVLAPNADGSLSMIYVSVSLGGWATSSLNHAVSTDGGLSFGDPVRLVTSPMFNLSTHRSTLPTTALRCRYITNWQANSASYCTWAPTAACVTRRVSPPDVIRCSR